MGPLRFARRAIVSRASMFHAADSLACITAASARARQIIVCLPLAWLNAAPQSSRQNRIGVTPIARRRNAGNRRTLQPQFAASAWQLDDENLPAGDRSTAAAAVAFIVQRMPVMKLVEVPEQIELVLGGKAQRSGAHVACSRVTVVYAIGAPAVAFIGGRPMARLSLERRSVKRRARANGKSDFGFARVFLADTMRHHDEEFQLTIPIEDAFAFSMGECESGSTETPDAMRQLVGVMVIDALQYGEHWRIAAQARAFLAERWPDCPGFGAGNSD